MPYIRMLTCALSLFTLLPMAAYAQLPSIAADGIRNGASYALSGMPNAGIAQGSIFIVFGSNLGPANLVQVSSFPLPTSQGLAGTSRPSPALSVLWTHVCTFVETHFD